MNFFFISELYTPRIGGTITYVRETCKALVQIGHQVTLAVPGDNTIGSIEEFNTDGFKILKFGTASSSTGYFFQKSRIIFCRMVHQYLNQSKKLKDYEVIHSLFGLYLMEYFDFSVFKKAGKKVGVSIHNIPPEECGKSWKGDTYINFLKDKLRKEAVRLINKRRIKKQQFDRYIVPSKIVKKKLSNYIKTNTIQVIAHGGSGKVIKRIIQRRNYLNILTVARFIPHKNNHFIPIIAQRLKEFGLSFKWDIIGPNNHARYVKFVQAICKEKEVEQEVTCHLSVSFAQLTNFYQNANLYVQPSSEEGFCISTLDAALYGIPIIGTKAGAIPEIIASSHGQVANTSPIDIADKIMNYVHSDKYKIAIKEQAKTAAITQKKYTWASSAKQLVDAYTF